MTRNHGPVRIPEEIIDTAAQWFINMREPDVAPAERERFSEWLRASPAHVQAYFEIAAVWGDAAQVSERLATEIDETETNVVPLSIASKAGYRSAPTAEIDDVESNTVSDEEREQEGRRLTTDFPGRSPRVMRRWATAAVVVAAIGAVTWMQINRPPDYETGVGEQRTVFLDDGSIVRLNSRSKVSVRFEPERRGVELLEGQALFEVAKDPTRPFIVRSGDIAIRAVGTAFDVYRKQTGTVVTVVEGKVQLSVEGKVALGDEEDEESARDEENKPLSAGEQAVVKPLGTIERKEGINVAAATSWLQRELVFAGESLSAVVDEFNRYNRRTIVLADPSLVDLRVNAVFHSTNPEALLKFVSRYDGIQVTQTRSEIRIARRESEGP